MTLPTNYADGQTVHGSDLNAWDTAINTNTAVLAGTGQATLTNPLIHGYTELVQALGTVGSSQTIGALTSGTTVTATLTSATACTFTMPTCTAGMSFWLVLHQPASGTATTATFTGVKWPGGTAPTITATLSAIDVLAFAADGTNWYGNFAQAYA